LATMVGRAAVDALAMETKVSLNATPSALASDPRSNSQATPRDWDEAADVVIIGSGFAGLAAAIEARNAGATVTLLEKMKSCGGNSMISDGLIAAAGTPMQEKAGIVDSPESMYKDMLQAGLGLNHPDLAQKVATGSAGVLQWTIDYLGVKYLDGIDQLGGHSVPRTLTPCRRSGSVIVKQQLARVKELGVKVKTRTYLQRILRNSAGRVQGVLVRDGYTFPHASGGMPRHIQAGKAVILASGGFANDLSFRAAQDPRLTQEVDSTNKACTTAETLREALRIGAMPVQLASIQLAPWTSPDEKGNGVGPDFAYIALPYGIVIDPTTGQRFMNELADRKIRADAILKAGQPCIGLTDAKGIERSSYRIDHCLRKGVVKQFDELRDLAAAYGIPFEALKETIKRYNRYVGKKLDQEFAKPILPGAEPLTHPPYYAMRLWPKVHHTMGGVQINARAQVLDLAQQPIQGLYAAGEVTGGIHGACRLGSCAITDCLVFGRIAGKNAAAEKTQK